ncbi:MAG: AmmeMemoRadiSam system protein B [Bifidobacteriaceae bacterium]|jgi:AmmeMemoRadiSam system protein B|nr:AmmeMemoRadiSam system protein B [Bifidobacteriaceae bacterium]
MAIRPPAVAGMFYPDDPEVLRAQVDGLLDAAGLPGPPPKAVIAPHAGYQYSGSIAALAYATLRAAADRIEHVMLLGPCHRVGIAALALPGVEAMATPLGDVPVWADGVERASALNQVTVSSAVHAQEHSLEVHLPFLQRTLTSFDVLPLAVGWVDPTAVAEVLDAAWGGPETLVVVSSDLSHYHPYADAQRRDRATLTRILALDGPIGPDQACGAMPVNGLIVAAARRGAIPSLMGACNSGDTAGDHSRVVGYAAVRFDEPPTSEGRQRA